MTISATLYNSLRPAVNSEAAWTELVALLNAVSALSGTEAGYLDGVSVGVAAANKALVLNGTKSIATISNATITNCTTTNCSMTNADIGTITNNVTVTEAKNFTLGTTTGSKIGTAANQKLGFWGATAIVQPSSIGELVGGSVESNYTNASNFTGNSGTKAYTINDIVKHLKAAGILAAS